MSVFILKCIAVVSMIIDHTGYVLSLSGYSGTGTIYIMRSVGRLAFPIFAFLIVNGAQKSRDRLAYLSRLSLFALISQLPFTLAFSPANYLPEALRQADSFVAMAPLWLQHLPLILLTGLVYFLLLHRRGRVGLWCVLAALALPLFRLKLGGFLLIDAPLNVFYTLACSLALICAIDAIMTNDSRYSPVELALLVSAAAAAALYILPNSDYSYKGLVLIVSIYLFKDFRPAQAIAAAAWCAYMYGYDRLFLISGLSACLLIFLYRGRKGPSFKTLFYLIYPVHLLLLFLLSFMYNNSL